MADLSKRLEGSEVPSDFLEPKAFMRSNDNDWRIEQNRNAGPDAVQRSIAISLKRIADMLEMVIDVNRDEPFGPAIRVDRTRR